VSSGGPADRSGGPPEKEGIQLSDAATEELLRLEEERCRAISAGDVDALGRLLTDNLTHTHVTGRTQDKAAYLSALGGRPRTTTRRDLTVRTYGDTAIMTGILVNAFPSDGGAATAPMEAQALQVWVKTNAGWQQAAFVASPLP
jgi:ketosteroid isomerase-like protein